MQSNAVVSCYLSMVGGEIKIYYYYYYYLKLRRQLLLLVFLRLPPTPLYVKARSSQSTLQITGISAPCSRVLPLRSNSDLPFACGNSIFGRSTVVAIFFQIMFRTI